MPLLRIEHLTVFFGGLRAVYDFSFEVERGQVRGLIGPNGAGKSTVFNLITGIHKPTEGQILFDGHSLAGLQPHQIAALGIGRTFQNLRLWRHMTVREHVKLARYSKLEYGLVGAFFGTPARLKQESEAEKIADRLLEIMGIGRFADQVVTGLPYGVLRRVEMARAMATEPKLLLLDEPTAGMNPEELSDMVQVIRRIRDEFEPAVFLIEHRMKVVMDLCERIQTLDFGQIIAEGTADEIRSNPKVIDAYLGKEVTT